MLLETIALLLPFIVLGLIGLFVAMLLIEVQKQQNKTRVRKRTKQPLLPGWAGSLIIGGIFLYCIVYFQIPSFTASLIFYGILAFVNLYNGEQSAEFKQPYQRVPVVPPKRNQTSSVPSSYSPSNNSSTPSKPASPQRNSIFQRQRPNPLQEKLLAMLNGDRAGAERLLRHAKQMNPGRNEDWYFDKVIYDIERDRR